MLSDTIKKGGKNKIGIKKYICGYFDPQVGKNGTGFCVTMNTYKLLLNEVLVIY